MKAAFTMFTSLFVLLASLKAVSGQFAGIPECGATCVENVAKDKSCADTTCVCAEQSAIMACIYRTCPVEDRAGSAYFVRQECANAPPPAPASSSSTASSASPPASASSSATSSEAAPEEPDASSTGAPATPGTATPASNSAPVATTAPPTRNVASPTEPTPSRLVSSRSSASRASTTVVIQTIGANANDDETGLLGAATSVKAGMMGYAAAVLAMAVGAFLL